jgi:ABC-type sugar transport system substrate-binding protein
LRLAVGIVAIVSLAVGTGCGGDDDSGGGDKAKASSALVSEAQGIVDQATQEPAVKVQGPSFSAADAEGKTVWFINNCDCNVIGSIWRDYMKSALDRYGVKFVNFDGKFSVTDYNRGIQQAIAQKADVIVNQGITPTTVKQQIKAASEANIPVISTFDGVPELEQNRSYVPGLTAEVSYDYTKVGALQAAWTVADSKGDANVLFISNLDQPSSYYIRTSFLSEMKRLCPGCEVQTEDVPAGLAAKQLPGLVRSTLQRDRDINYVVPGFDLNVAPILSALRLADREDDVRMGSWNAIPPAMVAVKDPDSPMAMEMGAPNAWIGFAMADAALRAAAGVEPITQGGEDSNYFGIRMFTKDVVKDLDVTKYNDAELYGVSEDSLKQAYEEVWGPPTGP